MDPLGELEGLVGSHVGDRRVAAHSSRVGPLVVVADPLVVLRGGHRDHGLPVAEGEQRELFAFEMLLEDDAAARLAEAGVEEERPQRLARGARIGRDDHALPRGETVGLQHSGVGGAVDLGLRGLVGVEDDV